MRSLSERRHHRERVKKKFYRKNRQTGFWARSERSAGLFANHGKDCSCPMCGNPRKWFGDPTVQEKRAAEDEAQQRKDKE